MREKTDIHKRKIRVLYILTSTCELHTLNASQHMIFTFFTKKQKKEKKVRNISQNMEKICF